MCMICTCLKRISSGTVWRLIATKRKDVKFWSNIFWIPCDQNMKVPIKFSRYHESNYFFFDLVRSVPLLLCLTLKRRLLISIYEERWWCSDQASKSQTWKFVMFRKLFSRVLLQNVIADLWAAYIAFLLRT